MQLSAPIVTRYGLSAVQVDMRSAGMFYRSGDGAKLWPKTDSAVCGEPAGEHHIMRVEGTTNIVGLANCGITPAWASCHSLIFDGCGLYRLRVPPSSSGQPAALKNVGYAH
jgi:hypothetical protein